jgi:hypothetical protein
MVGQTRERKREGGKTQLVNGFAQFLSAHAAVLDEGWKPSKIITITATLPCT